MVLVERSDSSSDESDAGIAAYPVAAAAVPTVPTAGHASGGVTAAAKAKAVPKAGW